MDVRPISTQETIDLRSRVLRPHQPRSAWGAEKGIPLFWCDARERHGFTGESDFFEIEGIGPHKVMKR